VMLVVITKTNQLGVPSSSTWAERLLELARRAHG
jgi:hypothetical protein